MMKILSSSGLQSGCILMKRSPESDAIQVSLKFRFWQIRLSTKYTLTHSLWWIASRAWFVSVIELGHMSDIRNIFSVIGLFFLSFPRCWYVREGLLFD